ncbi:hypothetical protein P261_00080 [Lachnospiraceae bacterium TWA4]|nr:hypothetical protein P261_00080 [Lachnospiraceae bacterium TWA4]
MNAYPTNTTAITSITIAIILEVFFVINSTSSKLFLSYKQSSKPTLFDLLVRFHQHYQKQNANNVQQHPLFYEYIFLNFNLFVINKELACSFRIKFHILVLAKSLSLLTLLIFNQFMCCIHPIKSVCLSGVESTRYHSIKNPIWSWQWHQSHTNTRITFLCMTRRDISIFQHLNPVTVYMFLMSLKIFPSMMTTQKNKLHI